MAEFLKVLPYQQARQLVIDHIPESHIEYQPLQKCYQRVLADNITSPEDIPAFNRSTVDGYAVRAADTYGSTESMPGFLQLAGEVVMGREASIRIESGQCAWIPTGGMLPAECDAVVMVEYTEKLGEDTILISRPVGPGENVMQKGEDIGKGSRVLGSGVKLGPQQIGLLASLGIDRLPVIKPYRVGIISTGDEIIPVDQKPAYGQIRDVNSYAVGTAVEACGCLPHYYPIIKDDFSSLQQAVGAALQENDILILSGGSSVGVADYSLQVLLSFPEAKMLFHGIAIKPGKPTMAVRVGQQLIVGLPGHPVSALMVFNIICRPALQKQVQPRIQARITNNVASQAGRDDFLPVQLLQDQEGLKARPLLGKSGLMSILAHSDGYIHIPYEKQGIRAMDVVQVNLW